MKTVLCGLALAAPCAVAQSPSRDGPLLAGVALEPTASYYFFYPAGSLRLVGWDRDSMAIHGHGKRSDFHLGRSPKGGKFFIEPAQGETSTPIDLVVYYPRRGTVSVKAASATIVASDVSGSYSTVSGTVRLTGSVSSLEAETMDGNIDLDVNTPWLRAHTSSGHLLIRGAPQDVDASTISGTLDIASSAILRGRSRTSSSRSAAPSTARCSCTRPTASSSPATFATPPHRHEERWPTSPVMQERSIFSCREMSPAASIYRR